MSTATTPDVTGPAGSPGPREATSDPLGPLAVLGDPVRRDILRRLAQGPVCTCSDLVEIFDAKQPTISHHLKVLREAGLVVGERCGRFTYYGLVASAVRDLGQALIELATDVEPPPAC